MAIRNGYLHIRVVDAAGATRTPSGSDQVLVEGTALSYDAAKGFEYKFSGKKDIRVDVKYKGFAGLRQWFETEAPSTRPKFEPYWPGTDKDCAAAGRKRKGYLLECMTISRNAGGTASDRSASVFTVTVHLLPTREYVAAIGTDYWEGALSGGRAHKSGLPFHLYSQTFAKHLYLRKLVNSSSPFVMIDCQRGIQERWMRAFKRGWRRHSVLLTKTPAPTWPTAQSFRDWINDVGSGVEDVTLYLGASDIYRYLSDKGSRRPGTVAEFSVFSHSWISGPILFNTPGSGTTTRSAKDLDLRAQQDFVAPNVSNWPKVKDALAAGANIHIWGCFATTLLNAMVMWLLKKPAATARFRQRIHGRDYDLSRAQVIGVMKRAIEEPTITYMKAIARYSNRTAWGGPPGFGSEWKLYSTMKAIPGKLRKAVGGVPIMNVPATRSPASAIRRLYESAQLGSQKFNWFGHMRYKP
ncbi:MAG: hypothetical protein AB1714_01930 [Acidobacteriota bacterium]